MSMTMTDNTEWLTELVNPTRPGIITDYAQVKVYNEGTEEVVWVYGGETRVIPPINDSLGRKNFAITSYHMMVYYCGDPRAVDVDDRNRPRTEQFRRLCVVYGVYENTGGANPDLNSAFPKLRVVTPTNEYPITTVLDDPDGKTISRQARQDNVLQQQSDIIAQQAQILANLQREMDELKRQQGMQSGQRSEQQVMGDAEIQNMRVTDSPDIVPEPVESTEPPIDLPDSPTEPAVKSTSKGVDEFTAALMTEVNDDEDSSGPVPDTAQNTVPNAGGPLFGK